jgi:hypothetical protein
MADPNFQFDPVTGHNDTEEFLTNPPKEAVRGYMQRLHDQTRDFINNTLITWIKATFLTPTGDFRGTINGGDVTLTEPGLSGAFNAHKAETATEKLFHRLICTSTTRPEEPVAGKEIYETDTKKVYSWNGTEWVETGGGTKIQVLDVDPVDPPIGSLWMLNIGQINVLNITVSGNSTNLTVELSAPLNEDTNMLYDICVNTTSNIVATGVTWAQINAGHVVAGTWNNGDSVRVRGKKGTAIGIWSDGVALTKSPIARWKLNEASGATVADDIAGNDGTCTGTTVIAGVSGNARHFDGSSFIDVPFKIPVGAFSVRFNIRVVSIPGATNMIFDDCEWLATNIGQYLMVQASTGKIAVGGEKGAGVGNDRYSVVGGTSICDNTWKTVIVTDDNTTNAGAIKVYVDGVLYAQATPNAVRASVSTHNLRFGRIANTANNSFTGDLDEIEIYDYAISV